VLITDVVFDHQQVIDTWNDFTLSGPEGDVRLAARIRQGQFKRKRKLTLLI
jgi:hypothetical protein